MFEISLSQIECSMQWQGQKIKTLLMLILGALQLLLESNSSGHSHVPYQHTCTRQTFKITTWQKTEPSYRVEKSQGCGICVAWGRRRKMRNTNSFRKQML